MVKVNLQVRLDEEVVDELDHVASGSRSVFVREAVVEKLQRERDRKREQAWIEALKKKGGASSDDEDWIKAEAWEEK